MMATPVRGAVFGAIFGALLASSLTPSPVKAPGHMPSVHFTDMKTEAQLNSILENNHLVMVDFYSEQCAPCKRLKPVIFEIATTYADKVKVVGVNVREMADVVKRFEVKALPSVIVFRDGQPIHRSVGLEPEKAYQELLDCLLAKPDVTGKATNAEAATEPTIQ